MNFLADESVDRQIVERVRQDGHQVWYVAEMEPGVSDDVVLNLANQKTALLLTADKDFGDGFPSASSRARDCVGSLSRIVSQSQGRDSFCRSQ